ncbi:DNA cytosine methyltransferase [Sphingobium sp.]|uniref:DNA cytosine methyltransferase n=1 Tax=Sphingobium sp. TaxID=1912891 RepID=UPI003BB4B9DD
MIAATVCSGIGAPEVAMPHWQWTLASEIEAAPRAIMAHRHGAQDARRARNGGGPALWGDFTAIRVRFLRRLRITLPQWLVAGTPCQSFSVAGLRGGMADARGNLTMEFLRLVHALRRAGSLRGFLWENVPGILSHADNPFGCFLAGIVGSDTPVISPLKRGRWPSAGMVDGPFGKAAWRVSDAQYFGLAQRRARVILVASFVDGIDPAAVLFERAGLHGNHPPRREPGQAAPTIPSRSTGGGGLGTDFDCDGGLIAETAPTLTASFGSKLGLDNQHIDSGGGMFVTHSLRGEGFDVSEDGTGRGTPLVPVAFSSKDYGADAATDLAPTLRAIGHAKSHANAGGQMAIAYTVHADAVGRTGEAKSMSPDAEGRMRLRDAGMGISEESSFSLTTGQPHVVAFDTTQVTSPQNGSNPLPGDPCHGLSAKAHPPAIASPTTGVRRLMPVECERLQGFPDHFTAIPYRTRTVDADEAELAAIEGRAVWRDGDRIVTDCIADGPRYKALGNSMPVNVIRHYLQRVERQAA